MRVKSSSGITTYSLMYDEDHDLLPCGRTSIKFVNKVIFIHGGRPLLETLKKAEILRAIALERKQSNYGLLKGEGEPYL